MKHQSPDKDYVIQLERYDVTKIIFGEGAFTQIGTLFQLDGTSNAAFITGGLNSSVASGAQQGFFDMASGFSLETPLFSGVPAEPDIECVRKMVDFFEMYKPQAVVAAGGGSVMDAAKAAYLSYQTKLDVTELFGVSKASEKFPSSTFKRVLCVPTTSGTGSEVTPYSNIVDKARNLKFIIADEQLTPEYAFVDPTFTYSMNRELTATTALDALTHALESFINVAKYDAEAEAWALDAIKLIHYALPVVLADPSSSIGREMLSAASTLAGMCIRVRPTALPHLCSYSMWGKIPHGLAVALMLPHFWRYYLANKDVEKLTLKLSGIFENTSDGTESAEKTVDAIEKFIWDAAGICGLSALDAFNEELIEKIARDAEKNPSKLASAPRSVPVDESYDIISGILKKAL